MVTWRAQLVSTDGTSLLEECTVDGDSRFEAWNAAASVFGIALGRHENLLVLEVQRPGWNDRPGYRIDARAEVVRWQRGRRNT